MGMGLGLDPIPNPILYLRLIYKQKIIKNKIN